MNVPLGNEFVLEKNQLETFVSNKTIHYSFSAFELFEASADSKQFKNN